MLNCHAHFSLPFPANKHPVPIPFGSVRAFFVATCIATLLTTALADTGEGLSLAFAVDTRNSVTTGSADSDSFVLNTRYSTATGIGDSSAFILDTRHLAITGSADSDSFVIDTWGLRPGAGLIIEYLLGKRVLTPTQQEEADTNKDGKIGIEDAFAFTTQAGGRDGFYAK